MNLEDLVDENGLQQDEWSLTAPTFGEDNQLTVVGWSGKCFYNKHYILKCMRCSEDLELFGQGYFRSKKGHLVRGQVPCGCTRTPRWSEDQFAILCSRKARELGYTFLGFVGDWKGAYTRTEVLCEEHGEWSSGNINNLFSIHRGCPKCHAEAIAKANKKPDDVMIASFFASGGFHPDTKFWRSERKNNRGWCPYWYMFCPECDERGESQRGDLQQGKRPCACNNQRQQECYINLLIDDHNNPIAIKFGIAIDSKQRIKKQDLYSVYTIKQHSVYQFLDAVSCKRAERECKKELECGVVLKRDMKDGYTETTYAYNLDKIVEIYERNGGIRVD